MTDIRKRKEIERNAALLLSSVGIANIGEWIYFIALNIMILSNGGIVLTVGILYIIRPIASILTNAVCSTFVDRLNKKKWLYTLDFIRAVLVAFLLFNQSIYFIYLVVFLIQVCSTIYVPLSVSYTTLAIPKAMRLKFNSWNSLVSSGGFLIGPGIAGLLLSIGTPSFAILINVLALFISGILSLFLKDYHLTSESSAQESFIEESKSALKFLASYYNEEKNQVIFYFLISSLFVFAAGLDSVEAAFSKNILYLSDGEYGLLVSISGAGYVIGSIFNSLIVGKLNIKQLILFGSVSYVVGYVVFTAATGFFMASVGFFILSFALAYINTGFSTFIQNVIPTEKMGQILTAFNTINALMQVVIIAVVSGLASYFHLRTVLFSTEILMIVIVFFIVKYLKKINLNGSIVESEKVNEPV